MSLHPTTPLWPILLFLPIVLIGLMLLVRGLRGFAIDDHPICRACGFDLFGRPQGATVCSECGAGLANPDAIQIGRRRRRPVLAGVGGLLILPSLLLIGMIVWGASGNVNWLQYEPAWYVLHECKSSDALTRDAALDEMFARVTAGALAKEQVNELCDLGLAAQADLKTTWLTKWGDLIEAAQKGGRLSPERWQKYFANMMQYTLVTRPETRRGDDVVARIVEQTARCGERSSFNAWIDTTLLPSDLVSSENTQLRGRDGSTFSAHGSGSIGHEIKLDPKLLAAAPDGEKTLRVRLKVDFYDHWTNGLPPALASKTYDLQSTWKLVPADAPTVKAIDDPGVRDAVQKAISIRRLELRPNGDEYVNMSIELHEPPVPLAYKVILRAANGREWPVNGIYIQKNSRTSWGTGGSVKGLAADKVDVIFRPDERTALNTTDMHEYYNEEVVFKDVAVIRPTPATKR